MKTFAPLVSVIIPAYNAARFIGETVETVCKQTYRNWELIVVDDGSTDSTKAILEPYMDRIQYFFQENKGTSAARNAGLRKSKGELIAFLDNDDLWLPEKLELQVWALRTWPDAGFVFTDGISFNESGIRQNSLLPRSLKAWISEQGTSDPLVSKGWLADEFFLWNPIRSATSVLARKECIEYVGAFDETIAVADDYDLWLRMALRYPIVLIRSCLYMWREREDSCSGPLAARAYRWEEASIPVLEKHWHVVPAELRGAVRAHLAEMHWFCGRGYFDLDQFRSSRRMLLGCLRYKKIFIRATLFLLVSYLGPSLVGRLRQVKHQARLVWQRFYPQCVGNLLYQKVRRTVFAIYAKYSRDRSY